MTITPLSTVQIGSGTDSQLAYDNDRPTMAQKYMEEYNERAAASKAKMLGHTASVVSGIDAAAAVAPEPPAVPPGSLSAAADRVLRKLMEEGGAMRGDPVSRLMGALSMDKNTVIFALDELIQFGFITTDYRK